MSRQKIVQVVGTRPNFMKSAPLMEQLQKHPGRFEPVLIHTGQHYDHTLSQVFFDDLKMNRPDIYLNVGSASHAVQTAKIMIELEQALTKLQPDLVVVFGDVNSTLATAVVTSKLCFPLAHVEAGLRSFDNTMPEEINRILTDRVSDYLFVSESAGLVNLKQEGCDPSKVHYVGNIMIDSLERHREAAAGSDVLDRLGLKSKGYALLTMHRPANVDDTDILSRLIGCMQTISKKLPVVFPCHPRTRNQLDEHGLIDDQYPGFRLIQPQGYLDFVKLQADARLVLTDSGGVQEETTCLNVPCITLRDTTELLATVESGTNTLCGNDVDRILATTQQILDGTYKTGTIPELWDGRAAERIVDVLLDRLPQ